jgi:hypothetical protein
MKNLNEFGFVPKKLNSSSGFGLINPIVMKSPQPNSLLGENL